MEERDRDVHELTLADRGVGDLAGKEKDDESARVGRWSTRGSSSISQRPDLWDVRRHLRSDICQAPDYEQKDNGRMNNCAKRHKTPTLLLTLRSMLAKYLELFSFATTLDIIPLVLTVILQKSASGM